MVRYDVADLVTDHGRELIFALEIREQASVDEDVAFRRGKGVDVGNVDHREMELPVGLGAVGDQTLADLLHVSLPARVVVDLPLLLEFFEHFLAGFGVRERLPRNEQNGDGQLCNVGSHETSPTHPRLLRHRTGCAVATP